MENIIGKETFYNGTEYPWLQGRVRIVAVCKNGALPNIDVDSSDYAYITFNSELERLGEVTAADRVEVEPWIEEMQRFSFVTTNPRAIDLACFNYLIKEKTDE